MNVALRWSLLAVCGLTLMTSRAHAQTPAPDQAPPADPTPRRRPRLAPDPAPMAPPPVVTAPPPKPTAQGPLKIETPNGSNIKFGLLLQPQFQSVSSAHARWVLQQPLPSSNPHPGRRHVVRCARLLRRHRLPNLFLATHVTGEWRPTPDTAVKATPGMNIQDAFVTYKPMGDLFKVDAGYMLPPLAHNAVQGATTLYSWDYFAYTFQSSNVVRQFGSREPGRPRPRRPAARPRRWATTSSTASACSRAARRPRRDRGRGTQHLPRHRPRAGQPARPRDRLLLRGHLPRREEDPVAGRRLRHPGQLQVLRRRRVRRPAAGAGRVHGPGQRRPLERRRVRRAGRADRGHGRGGLPHRRHSA